MAKLVSKVYGDALFEAALEDNRLSSLSDEVTAVKEIIAANDALFFIVNCYTTGFSCSTLNEALSRSIQKEKGGHIECGENLLPVTTNNSVLPCGIFGRWTND